MTTERTKSLPKRRSKATIAKKLVLFEGIPLNYRAKRFDQVTLMGRPTRQMPDYLEQAMNEQDR